MKYIIFTLSVLLFGAVCPMDKLLQKYADQLPSEQINLPTGKTNILSFLLTKTCPNYTFHHLFYNPKTKMRAYTSQSTSSLSPTATLIIDYSKEKFETEEKTTDKKLSSTQVMCDITGKKFLIQGYKKNSEDMVGLLINLNNSNKIEVSPFLSDQQCFVKNSGTVLSFHPGRNPKVMTAQEKTIFHSPQEGPEFSHILVNDTGDVVILHNKVLIKALRHNPKTPELETDWEKTSSHHLSKK